jgi:hypothetical protein
MSIPVTGWIAETLPIPERVDRGRFELPPTVAPAVVDGPRLERNAAIVWLAGLLLLGGRAIGQNIVFMRRLRTANTVTDAETLALFVRCKEVMGVRKPSLQRAFQ